MNSTNPGLSFQLAFENHSPKQIPMSPIESTPSIILEWAYALDELVNTSTTLQKQVSILDSINDSFDTVTNNSTIPVDISSIITSFTHFCRFLLYVFEKRLSLHQQSQNKKGLRALSTRLEQSLRLLRRTRLSNTLVNAITHVCANASNSLIRDDSFKFFFDWISTQLKLDPGASVRIEQHIFIICNWIFTGLTDVWSAVRKTCAHKLFEMVHSLSLPQLEVLYSLIISSLCDSCTTWQVKEGALLGIISILKGFKPSLHTQGSLQLGTLTLQSLPSFITRDIRGVLYLMLIHPQFSVRSNASNVFSSLLSRSPISLGEEVFEELMAKLRPKLPDELIRSIQSIKMSPPPPNDGKSLSSTSAFTAEGLLGCAIIVLDHIRIQFIIERWIELIPLFESYLAHEASSVRQVASSFFVKLSRLGKGTPYSSLLLRLITQSLASSWCVSLSSSSYPMLSNFIDSSSHSRSFTSLPPALPISPIEMNKLVMDNPLKTPASPSYFNSSCFLEELDEQLESSEIVSHSWEWREGRLLFYEPLLNSLLNMCDLEPSSCKHHPSASSHSSFSSMSHPLPKPQNVSLSRSIRYDNDQVQILPPSTSMFRAASDNLFFKVNRPPKSHSPQKRNDLHTFSDELHNTRRSSIVPSPRVTNDLFSSVDDSCSMCLLKKLSKPLGLRPFLILLHHMLLQTASCAIDTRWELRRMADQVLPDLSRIISIYDFSWIHETWIRYCSSDETFLRIVACLSMVHSLRSILGYSANQSRSDSVIDSKYHPTVRIVLNASCLLESIKHLPYASSLLTSLPELLQLVHFMALSSDCNRLNSLCVELVILIGVCVPSALHPSHISLVISRINALRAVSSLQAVKKPIKTWQHWLSTAISSVLPDFVKIVTRINPFYAAKLALYFLDCLDITEDSDVRIHFLSSLTNVFQHSTTKNDFLGDIIPNSNDPWNEEEESIRFSQCIPEIDKVAYIVIDRLLPLIEFESTSKNEAKVVFSLFLTISACFSITDVHISPVLSKVIEIMGRYCSSDSDPEGFIDADIDYIIEPDNSKTKLDSVRRPILNVPTHSWNTAPETHSARVTQRKRPTPLMVTPRPLKDTITAFEAPASPFPSSPSRTEQKAVVADWDDWDDSDSDEYRLLPEVLWFISEFENRHTLLFRNLISSLSIEEKRILSKRKTFNH